MTSPNWGSLQKVYELAGKAQVNFSMHYQEASHDWYFETSSPAPDECWTGKDHSFDIAVECVIEFLELLTNN